LYCDREAQQGEVTVRSLAYSAESFAPASCVIDADIDAEDQRERDPQKGQRQLLQQLPGNDDSQRRD
jgi:hypothetical protein